MIDALKRLMTAGLEAGISNVTQADGVDIGKAEFLASCASCHGTDGRGRGPVSAHLKSSPPT